MNNAAGPIAEKLFEALNDDTVSEEEKELFAGLIRECIQREDDIKEHQIRTAELLANLDETLLENEKSASPFRW